MSQGVVVVFAFVVTASVLGGQNLPGLGFVISILQLPKRLRREREEVVAAQAVTAREFLAVPDGSVLCSGPPYFSRAVCRALKKRPDLLRQPILYFILCVQGRAGEPRRLTLAAGQIGRDKETLPEHDPWSREGARSALARPRPGAAAIALTIAVGPPSRLASDRLSHLAFLLPAGTHHHLALPNLTQGGTREGHWAPT